MFHVFRERKSTFNQAHEYDGCADGGCFLPSFLDRERFESTRSFLQEIGRPHTDNDVWDILAMNFSANEICDELLLGRFFVDYHNVEAAILGY